MEFFPGNQLNQAAYQLYKSDLEEYNQKAIAFN